MKKVSKLLFVLIASVLCISTMCSMAVFAEDAATVAVSIKADKESYAKGDTMKFDVSVSNSGSSEIGEISLKASLPDKFKISENETYTLKLAANETKNYTVSAEGVKAVTTAAASTSSTGKSAESPKTGDSAPIALMLVLGAASVVAIKSKKNRKVLSVMVTAALCGTLAMQSIEFTADAAAKNEELTATADFKYDGSTETITVKATYSVEEAGGTAEKQVLDYNKQALRDVTGVSNARQLGGYINTNGKKIKQNVLLRTGNLAHITEGGIKALQEKYKVSDIIDLRYDRELNPNTIDKEIEGINHHNVPMSASKETAEKVFSQNPELYAQMQELQRNAGKPGGSIALSIFQAEVGVISVQKHIEYFESEEAIGYYRDVFDIFLNKPEDSAILFHCAGGKDRTGMISMLMLAALDFDKDIMMQDYMMSNVANAAKIEETRIAAEEKIKNDPELLYNVMFTAEVYEEVMETNIDDLTKQYGSVKNFLREKVGLTDDDFAKLQQLYLED